MCHILHFFLAARSRTLTVCLICAPGPVEECPGLLSSATGASHQPATAQADSTTPEGAGTEGNSDPTAEGGSTPVAASGQDEGGHNSASTTSVARSGEFTGQTFSSINIVLFSGFTTQVAFTLERSRFEVDSAKPV